MIQKRGDRWRVVVQADRDPLTGRRLQLSGLAHTEREAVALERQLRLDAERKASASVTLAELVEEWRASKPSLAATTRVNHRVNLENRGRPIELGQDTTTE